MCFLFMCLNKKKGGWGEGGGSGRGPGIYIYIYMYKDWMLSGGLCLISVNSTLETFELPMSGLLLSDSLKLDT